MHLKESILVELRTSSFQSRITDGRRNYNTVEKQNE